MGNGYFYCCSSFLYGGCVLKLSLLSGVYLKLSLKLIVKDNDQRKIPRIIDCGLQDSWSILQPLEGTANKQGTIKR